MSSAEIKQKRSDLIEWIEHLTDADLLATLDNVRLSANEGDWWDDLSEGQKNHINEGLNDIETGRTMSSQEFWTRLKNG